MSGYPNNFRVIFNPSFAKVAPDSLSCLNYIHHRHAEVSQDETVLHTVFVGLFDLV